MISLCNSFSKLSGSKLNNVELSMRFIVICVFTGEGSVRQKPGGGIFVRNFFVGMCRWDPGTLSLHRA